MYAKRMKPGNLRWYLFRRVNLIYKEYPANQGTRYPEKKWPDGLKQLAEM
jgi:hypothetical protein